MILSDIVRNSLLRENVTMQIRDVKPMHVLENDNTNRLRGTNEESIRICGQYEPSESQRVLLKVHMLWRDARKSQAYDYFVIQLTNCLNIPN